jgi:hypothetical protein
MGWNDNKFYYGNDDYTEIPSGMYEVAVTKIEPSQSKAGSDMVKIWFKIVKGDYKGSILFMNQAIMNHDGTYNKGFLKKVDKILSALVSDLPHVKTEYSTPFEYKQMLMDVFEAISCKYEYGLKYDVDTKGFGVFEIVQVYNLEKENAEQSVPVGADNVGITKGDVSF